MDKKFNGATVETNGVRSIAGGGTGATTAEQARINLGISSGGGVTSYNDLTNLPTLGTAAATASTDYATAAQGTTADSALQPAALTPYRTSSDQDTIDAGKASTTHKSSHATGGTDALTPADIGASATGHTHPLSQLEQSSAANGQVATWNGTAWVPTTPASIPSDTTGITGADQVTNIVSLTQAEYDAIVTPNASTLYIITD